MRVGPAGGDNDMAFEFVPAEPVRKALRRIAGEQLDAALEYLTGRHKGSRDQAVHEVRKCFRRLRGVLRLVRPVIGEKTFRAENARFRDAARPLTEVRDAKVQIETFDNLFRHFREQTADRSFADIRAALTNNLRSTRTRVLDGENAFASAAGAVRDARGRVRDWADVPNKWSSVGPGLEETYHRTRGAFAAAARRPSVAALHEWRKQAKYQRYQLQLLRPLWPQSLDELADEADQVCDLIGDYHDLAVLETILSRRRIGTPVGRETLVALSRRRRIALKKEALLLGERYYLQKPAEFAARMKGYWRTWRSQEDAPRTA